MSKIKDALQKARGEPPAGEASGEPPLTPAPSDAGSLEVPAPGDAPELRSVPSPAPAPGPEFPPAAPPAREAGEPSRLSGDFSRELARLRASVERLLPAAPRVILVVGSVPGEGASTVAARFAERLGEDPRLRALLVDADLRNADPRPVELVDPGTGFASVLSGRAAPEAGIRGTQSPGLDVLPSEGVAADPYALCSTERLPAVLQDLRGRGDYVILDGAPVLVAPETALLAQAADGVVLVVRAGRTKREVIQRALERLAQHEARVLGVVMNRQKYVIPEFIYRRL